MKKSIYPCFAIVLLLITGCSQTKEITEIKQRVIKPEVIEDSLPAVINDSIFTAVELIKDKPGQVDTVKYIEFRPDSLLLQKINELQKENKLPGTGIKNIGEFYIKIKPDSIVIWDTVITTQIIEKKIETPLLSKAGLILIGIILGLAGLYYIRR